MKTSTFGPPSGLPPTLPMNNNNNSNSLPLNYQAIHPNNLENARSIGNYPIQNATVIPRSRTIVAAETAWLQVAATAQLIGELERAQSALETILRHNPYHCGAHVRLGHLLHNQKQYLQAAEIYQKTISLLEASSSSTTHNMGVSLTTTWASLAHCWLLLDDLPRAFHAYQQALSYPGGARDSVLWFGVGILYDRYGADDHALEAFAAVLKLEAASSSPLNGPPPPPVSNGNDSNAAGTALNTMESNNNLPASIPSPLLREVYYRVGILLRNNKRYSGAIKCFEYGSYFPPAPLQRAEVKLQLAITLDANGDMEAARKILESVVIKEGRKQVVTRGKAYLAWTLVRPEPSSITYEASAEQEQGLNLLRQVVQEDSNDPLAWYFLGRAYLLRKMYTHSYEAYQEAVYRDGQNPAFWNSIGILYLEIKQYRDALDAFSRAIHQNSTISQIWWNLGLLYESCNSQLNDAIDAYQRAAELAPNNPAITLRISHLRSPPPPTSTIETHIATIEVQEVDPLPYLMRPILLGTTHIPPQKTSPPISAPPAANNTNAGISSTSAGANVNNFSHHHHQPPPPPLHNSSSNPSGNIGSCMYPGPSPPPPSSTFATFRPRPMMSAPGASSQNYLPNQPPPSRLGVIRPSPPNHHSSNATTTTSPHTSIRPQPHFQQYDANQFQPSLTRPPSHHP